MFKSFLIQFIHLITLFMIIHGTPCTFNDRCVCTYDQGQKNLTVGCYKVSEFPTFAEYNSNGMQVQVEVQGDFTSIPAKCVSSFTGAQTMSLSIVGQLQVLSVDPQAFVVDAKTNFSLLLISYINFPTIPSTDWSAINHLKFYESQIPVINDNAFTGFVGSVLELDDSTIQTISPNAFSGVGTLKQLSLNGNFLNSISPAFKTLKAGEVDASNNGIYQILDFSFCECNTVGACPNTAITTLYFDLNPMSNLSVNAFANLPNLIYLEFDQGALTSVPTSAINKLSNLVSIDLSRNAIKTIEPNAFLGMESMYYIYFDYNPIMSIDAGAFNGLTQMTSLPLANLPLKTIDLLITYGMTSLKTLSFTTFPQLTTVELSDYTKLPQSLQVINMTNSPVNTISSDVQYWLSSSKDKYLDISYNVNLTCDSTINWMATFVCCSPVQILASGAACATSKQALTSYLQSLQPVCN